MTDPAPPTNETDPRFPSGPWRGCWYQHSMRGWMQLDLQFVYGRITGSGTDMIGTFIMRGSYSTKTGTVTIRKHYTNQHMVSYTGTADPNAHLHGDWDILAIHDHGPWRIWPAHRSQARTTTVAEAIPMEK